MLLRLERQDPEGNPKAKMQKEEGHSQILIAFQDPKG
jgi:hypothetical protein